MRKMHSKKTTKLIISVIAILMLCNFVMPNYTYAVTTQRGGSALKPMAKLLCFIPDMVNNVLQHMLVSPNNIKKGDKYEILYSPGIIFSGTVSALDINFIEPDSDKTVYNSEFTYQVIGSGISIENIAEKAANALSANCTYEEENNNALNANELIDSMCNSIKNSEYAEATVDGREILIAVSRVNATDWSITCEINGKVFYKKDSTQGDSIEEAIDGAAGLRTLLKAEFRNNDSNVETDRQTIKQLILEQKDYFENEINNNGQEKVEKYIEFTHACNNQTVNIKIEYNHNSNPMWTCYGEVGSVANKTYRSSAGILQPIIASWYKVLRKIALVGLLSALVYIGIRMVLVSSSAKESAKYKKMFKNWFVALCLLFVLHYIMSLTITVVGQINSVIGTSALGIENSQDIMLTTLRNRILDAGDWSTVIAEVVIYDVVTVYTIIYTIQYIRRVIYLAFLTTIAPLITLTYPLDKIKDNKAQAFDMWIKDYVFFTLLQVVHILLYYIFIGQSVDLASKGSWIYAIVAIGFLTQAEKIMKKMFGFEKSKSMGALTAGATGALVMNAINKMSQKPPKDGSKGEAKGKNGENSKGVRTSTANPLAALMARNNNNSDTAEENEDVDDSNSNEGAASTNTSQTQNTQASSEDNEAIDGEGQEENRSGNRRTSRGAAISSAFAGMGGNSSTTSGSSANIDTSMFDNLSPREDNKDKKQKERKDKIKRTLRGVSAVYQRYGRQAVKRTAGAFLGAAGGAIGFASGAAQGDIGKALTGMAAGGTAGYYTGQRAVTTARNVAHTVTHLDEPINRVRDTYIEGAEGKEFAQNQRFDREFRSSQSYANLKKNNPNFSDEYIQKMLDAGITDAKKMDKILKQNAKHPRKFSIEKAIGYSTLAEKCPDDILYDNRKFIRYFRDRDLDITPEEVETLRKNIVEFK